MSKQAVEEILRKASSDARFRARLKTDFAGATKGYKLTEAEKGQLRAVAIKAVTSKQVPARRAAEEIAAMSQDSLD